MKKKLTLSKETIRKLSEVELKQVVGAYNSILSKGCTAT
jgi:hypothetical protein